MGTTLFRGARAETGRRVVLLSIEDENVQSTPEAQSERHGNRAQRPRFFEELLLRPLRWAHRLFDERFVHLFNLLARRSPLVYATPGRSVA